MCRAEVPTYPGDEISELPRVVGKLTSARGGFATTRRARGAADPLARMILARARCAWHAYLSPPRITLAPATRTRPPPTLRRRHHHHHHPRAMSTADDAPRGDSPNPGDAASYDEQLAVVRALKASGAPPDQLRAASARLNTLKRANKLPRYTPSRKSARRHPPGDTGRATPGPARPRGTRRRAPRVQTTGQGPDHDLPIVFADRKGVPPGPIPSTRRQVLPRPRRRPSLPTLGTTSPPPPPPSPDTKPPSRTPRGRSRSAANGE